MSFTPRLTRPESGNKYYITKAAGGYSSAVKGSPTDSACNVLANCVGYAYGRFNEIVGDGCCKYLSPVNAENFIQYKGALEVGQEPRLGACMVWQKGSTLKGSDGAGHVAIVEKIISPTEIITSESGWNASKPFWTQTRKKGGDGNWGQGSGYKFLGFIYNPAPCCQEDNTTGGTKMNKKPVSYLQTDARWKSKPYRVKGENSTIGDSGCGPTAAAMLLSTLTGKTITPEDTCKWSVDHGYKALGNGTYYAYFAPQFAAYGIKCWQLNWVNAYHNPKATSFDETVKYLKQGYYAIALMKQGTWTSGGHFVVLWWADDKVRINDPASTKDARVNGNLATFKNEAAYFWIVDAREYNNSGKLVDGSVAEVKPENGPQAAPGVTAERKATGVAKSFNKALAGTYMVTAGSGLHIRNVAGSKTGSMVVLPNGTKVKNYGYYTEVAGVKWLYIQVAYQGVKYTGFSSGEWLKKV